MNSEDYLSAIVSTDRYCTFLHRTSRDLVTKVMENGVRCLGDIQSTSTWQPHDLVQAKNLYLAGQDHGDSIIVIRILRTLFERVRNEGYKGEEVLHEDIGFIDEQSGNFVIKPQFNYAWINRFDNSVHFNENYEDEK